ncbi:MAG: RND transporter, partial [Aquabacterium sp.]
MASGAPPHAGDTAALARWWARFQDPVLAELQAAAQQVSPGLAMGLARVARARAAVVSAGAADAPRLDAIGSVMTGRAAAAAPPTT